MKNLLLGAIAAFGIAGTAAVLNTSNVEAAAPKAGDKCSSASMLMMPKGECGPKDGKTDAALITAAAPAAGEKAACGPCPEEAKAAKMAKGECGPCPEGAKTEAVKVQTVAAPAAKQADDCGGCIGEGKDGKKSAKTVAAATITR